MNAELLRAASGPMCTTYAEVLAKLSAVEHALGEHDGLRWFTRLYQAMTKAVAERAKAGAFRDPAFMELLDCDFAGLYFAAITAFLSQARRAPRAWTPVFEARMNPRISALQFALAGVNAHINRDLPVALVDAFSRVHGEPEPGDARHSDYLLVNQILRDVQAQAKSYLITGALAEADALLGQTDDWFELWSLERARDAAWVAGEVQWHLRISPLLAAQQLATLDQLVGFAGRGLLLPAPAVPRLVPTT